MPATIKPSAQNANVYGAYEIMSSDKPFSKLLASHLYLNRAGLFVKNTCIWLSIVLQSHENKRGDSAIARLLMLFAEFQSGEKATPGVEAPLEATT